MHKLRTIQIPAHTSGAWKIASGSQWLRQRHVRRPPFTVLQCPVFSKLHITGQLEANDISMQFSVREFILKQQKTNQRERNRQVSEMQLQRKYYFKTDCSMNGKINIFLIICNVTYILCTYSYIINCHTYYVLRVSCSCLCLSLLSSVRTRSRSS